MLAPNACDRYLSIINDRHRAIQEWTEESCEEKPKKIACIQGLLYSFDTNGYEHVITGDNI